MATNESKEEKTGLELEEKTPVVAHPRPIKGTIMVNDKVVTHDGLCWIVADGYRTRKTGVSKGQRSLIRPSYHGTLQQVARKLVDLECEEAVNAAASLEDLILTVTEKLTQAVAELEKF